VAGRSAYDQEREGRLVTIDPSNLKAATGTDDRKLGVQIVRQTADAMWVPGAMSELERQDAVSAAMAALSGLAPIDTLEGMLASQMVATHNAAMECLRRAQLPNQSFEGREVSFKQASKLMALYARQMEALDKHRGRGQQKITVEHVTVNAGGQAIVGNIGAGGPAPVQEAVTPMLAAPDEFSPPVQIIDGASFLREARLKKPIPIPRGR
jgi:hypothetical protein